jgi:N-acetylglutamate synthase-like GNAT family acetyltransferase
MHEVGDAERIPPALSLVQRERKKTARPALAGRWKKGDDTMKSPKLTGVSSITGKTVYIRHATESDMVEVRAYLYLHNQKLSQPKLMRSEIVVAAEEDRMIGFGILEKSEDNSAGCVAIFEDGKRTGIGASIARHLMEYAPMKTIYVAGDKPGYFTELGYTRSGDALGKSTHKAASLCRTLKSGVPLAAYEKH